MKLFKYVSGADEVYAPAESKEEAYRNRAKVDHTFHFLPVEIEEVTVPGYSITLTPDDDMGEWDKQKLRDYLDKHNVEYVPQWGVEKLREAAKAVR